MSVEVGDLVEVGFKGDSDFMLGEVTKIISEHELKVSVKETPNNLKNFLGVEINVKFNHPNYEKNIVRKVDTYIKEKLHTLMHFAVDTNDKVWFYELAEKLNQMKK